MDSDGKIPERLVITLAHRIELNVNVHPPVSRHKIIFESIKKSFQGEDLEFIIVNFDPIFQAWVFQSSHYLHHLFLFSNVLVCDVVPACNLELSEHFSIEVSRKEDRAFTPFLLTNDDVFL